MTAKLPPKVTTCHYSPWALVRRGGTAAGNRPATRMAYLVNTIAPHGKAVALTGYLADTGMRRWTKSVRRIEWSDIVRQWHTMPTPATVSKVRRRLAPTPVIADDADRYTNASLA